MAKITIDLSGIAGLAPRYYGDKPYAAANPQYRHYGNPGQMADGIYNPISLLGFLSPANNTTKAVTGTSSYLISSALLVAKRISEASTDAIFFADEAATANQGKILNLDTAIDTSLDTAYTIPTTAGPVYYRAEDMILYQVNGINKIFFSRSESSTSTAGFTNDISIAACDFSSPDPDWASTAPQGATTFKDGGRMVFVVADNAILYVLNRNAIHSIDGSETTGGANGVINKNALVFLGQSGFTSGSAVASSEVTELIDGIDLRGKMWIGLHVNSASDVRLNSTSSYNFNQYIGVYVWDRRTTVASMQDFITIPGTKEFKSLHILQGQPMCFTISSEGYTQLRMWNGTEFKLTATLGKSAYPNFRRHSLVESGDMIYWLGADGIVYAFGKFEPGMENALYKIGDMTQQVTNGQTFSQAGIIIAANGVESVTAGRNTIPLAFYISFSDTGGNHLKKFYPHAYDPATTTQTAYTGQVYSLVKLLPKLAETQGVTLFFPAVGSGGSTPLLTVNVYLNHSTTVAATYSLTQDDAARGWASLPLGKANVNAIQLGFAWAAQPLANNITPYAAAVDYEPTTKWK